VEGAPEEEGGTYLAWWVELVGRERVDSITPMGSEREGQINVAEASRISIIENQLSALQRDASVAGMGGGFGGSRGEGRINSLGSSAVSPSVQDANMSNGGARGRKGSRVRGGGGFPIQRERARC